MPYFYSPGDTGDALHVKVDNTGTIGARFDYRGRRRAGTTSAPTAAVGAGAGSGATVAVATGSTDEVGTVTITCGTGTAAGTLATVTFNTAFATAPFVILTPKDVNSAIDQVYATTTTTTLVIKAKATTPVVSVAHAYDYVLVGGA